MAIPSRVVLLGDPVEHSFSASFQNAAFSAERIPVRYETWRVPPAELSAALDRIRSDRAILGANVTVPHKEAVVPLLDRLDRNAAEIGAVNTLRSDNSMLTGWNTDGEGFKRALRETGFDPVGKRVLLLGAGGAARAVAAALRDDAAQIWVAARNPVQARRLCEDLALLPDAPIGMADAPRASETADLIVNATPVGMDGRSLPMPGSCLRRGHAVFDLIYNPPLTPLLRAAALRGAQVTNGLAMLLYQGMKAFTIWTGRPAPEEAMRAALEQAANALPAIEARP